MISSRLGPCRDDEARVFRPSVDLHPSYPPPPPRLIVCLAAGVRSRSCLQPEVILAALQTAAAGLRALQLPFPCLCSAVLAPPLPSGSKIDNHHSGLKNERGREKCLEAWQRFALNGREKAGGAAFGDSGSRSGLLSEDSAKCLHRWMDLIIPDGRERKSSCRGKKNTKIGRFTLRNVSLYLCKSSPQIKPSPAQQSFFWHRRLKLLQLFSLLIDGREA